MECIGVEGMEFYSSIGYYELEKNIHAKLTVDVEVYMSIERAGATDRLEHTLNYERIHALCEEVCTGHYDLIETLAYKIHSAIKKNWPYIQKCKVCVSKWNPPIKGKVKKTFIKIEK